MLPCAECAEHSIPAKIRAGGNIGVSIPVGFGKRLLGRRIQFAAGYLNLYLLLTRAQLRMQKIKKAILILPNDR